MDQELLVNKLKEIADCVAATNFILGVAWAAERNDGKAEILKQANLPLTQALSLLNEIYNELHPEEDET